MTDISRRRALTILGATALAGPSALAQAPAQQRPRQTHEAPNQPATNTRQARSQPARKFFKANEYRTVRVLADDVIPRDARSGSATEAGVPDFIDFHLSVEETSADTRLAWRGGLRWLGRLPRERIVGGGAGLSWMRVTRARSSGLSAIIMASQMIKSGAADIVIAGGVESMSRAPWVQEKPATAFAKPISVFGTSVSTRVARSPSRAVPPSVMV